MNGHLGGATLWLDSRELLDPGEWHVSERDPLRMLLEPTKTKLTITSLEESSYHHYRSCQRSLIQDYQTRRITNLRGLHMRKQFKPIHNGGAQSENVPVFEGNAHHVAPSFVSRADPAAELIIRLQDRLMVLIEKIAAMDEKLREVDKRMTCRRRANESPPGSESSRELCPGHQDLRGSLVDGESATASDWPSVPLRILWFAWPILLLSAWNRFWPSERRFCARAIS